MPSHVVVFTDGRNEADQPTLSLEQLGQRLAAAKDPQRPVELTVVAFGGQPEAQALRTRSSRWTATSTRCRPRTR